jgi:uncharacterized protein YfaQ (DUF2300 family)
MTPDEALQLAIDGARERMQEQLDAGRYSAAGTERDMLEGLLAIQWQLENEEHHDWCKPGVS